MTEVPACVASLLLSFIVDDTQSKSMSPYEIKSMALHWLSLTVLRKKMRNRNFGRIPQLGVQTEEK